MSASGGHDEGHVSLLLKEQGCMEGNVSGACRRDEPSTRMPGHQIESGIERALAVIAESGLGSGILIGTPRAPVSAASPAAGGNARIRVRPEGRAQNREREQHQQRNGGERPQAIILAQTHARW